MENVERTLRNANGKHVYIEVRENGEDCAVLGRLEYTNGSTLRVGHEWSLKPITREVVVAAVRSIVILSWDTPPSALGLIPAPTAWRLFEAIIEAARSRPGCYVLATSSNDQVEIRTHRGVCGNLFSGSKIIAMLLRQWSGMPA